MKAFKKKLQLCCCAGKMYASKDALLRSIAFVAKMLIHGHLNVIFKGTKIAMKDKY